MERDPGVRLRHRHRSPQRTHGNPTPPRKLGDKSAYDATAKKLARLFNKNFETYAAGASAEVKAAASVI
jgi:ATP-dependent phosphoenolpyruvate carboxykinase